MKRPDNFDELLEVAKNRPDLRGAMSRVGIELKRVGSSRGGTRYQTSTKGRSDGDLSSVVFIENANGSWVIIDNKERTGKRDLDAIAALREFGGVSFDDAVYMLSGGAPAMPPSSPKIVEPTVSAESQAPAEYVPPQPCRENTKNVIAYLTQGRNIPYSLVKALIESDKIYPTYFENKETHKKTVMCGFKITDELGNDVGCDSCAAITMMRFKHVYAGSSRDYAWCFNWGVDKITKDTPLYFCEAPIDAMSLCALSGMPGVYISLSGTKDMTFLSMKDKLGGKPVICTDHDGGAGDRFAAKHSEYDRLVPPHGKDWNDTLKYHVENGLSFALQDPQQTEKTPKKAKSALEQSALEEKLDVKKMDFAKQVDLVLNGADTTSSHLLVMQTPEILKKAGLPDLPILITAKHVKTITQASGNEKANYHGVDIKTIKDIPKYISDPVIIADSLTRNDSVVVVTEAKDSNNNPIIAAIRLNGHGEINNRYIDANILTSAYGKENFETFLKNTLSANGLIYWNKKKSQRLSVNLGLQLPNILTSLRSNIIIHQTKAFVNTPNKKTLKDEQPINPKEAEMAKTKEKSPEAEPKAQANEEKEASAQDKLRAELKGKVQEVVNKYRTDPRSLAEFLAFSSRFNNYSGHNLRLIWAQNPHANFVAAASYFKAGMPDKNGKAQTNEKIYIKKGERALRIWKPYEITYVYVPQDNGRTIPMPFSHLPKEQQERAKTEGWKLSKSVKFTLVPVFDITQTTAPPEVYPKAFGFGGNTYGNAEEIFRGIKNYSENVLNCPVDIGDLRERKTSVRGFFIPDENRIVISDMLSGDGKVSTLIHEVGHAELHRDSAANLKKSTAQIELEADMYSLMIESKLGIEPTEARITHLGAHYEAYMQELQDKLPEGKSLDLNSDMEVLDNVLHRYSDQEALIEEYIVRQSSIDAQLAQAAPTPQNEQSTALDKQSSQGTKAGL